jgi:hypothetical protein
MSNVYRGPSIDASYQVPVHLAEGFQRRRLKCEKLSIYGRSSIKVAHFIPIRLQTWSPQAILVSDWLISKKSSPLKLLGQMNQNLVNGSG